MKRHGTNYAALGTMTGSLALNAFASSRLAKAEPAAADAESARLLALGVGVRVALEVAVPKGELVAEGATPGHESQLMRCAVRSTT